MEEPEPAHYRWSEVEEVKIAPAVSRRVISGESMMLARIELGAGQVVPAHSHENEQITTVLEGALRFWIGEGVSEIVDIAAGEVLQIPGNVTHKAEALKRTVSIDVFCPPRQDWLDGEDSRLHGSA